MPTSDTDKRPRNGMDRPLTVKSLSVVIGIFATLLGLLGMLHTSFVVPAILDKADTRIQQAVDRHESRPHPGAITRPELETVFRRLDELATKESVAQLREILKDIQARLRDLERGK